MPWLHVYTTLGLELCSIVPSLFAIWRCTAPSLVVATHRELEKHAKRQLRQAGFQLGFPMPLTKPCLQPLDMLQIEGHSWQLRRADRDVGTIKLRRFFSLQWNYGRCHVRCRRTCYAVVSNHNWEVDCCAEYRGVLRVFHLETANAAIECWLNEIGKCLE